MKSLISLLKKILFFEKFSGFFRRTFLYRLRKKTNALLASAVFSNPGRDFFVIGITGTNGKTTTANLLHFFLNRLVAKTVMISTAQIKIGDKTIANARKMSSLDVRDLQEILALAKSQGCKIAVLEVTSIGLDQARFDGIDFDIAVLTNITEDHLDYHGTMENYAAAKQKLFLRTRASHPKKISPLVPDQNFQKLAILPADDPRGRERLESLDFPRKISFGFTPTAQLRASDEKVSEQGSEFSLNFFSSKIPAKTKLAGRFNIQNILAARAVIQSLGISPESVAEILPEFTGVPGRQEPVEKNGTKFFIDFAHSPDSLEKILEFAHSIRQPDAKIHLLFGAPGNRDREKRPKMGAIADRLAGTIILTDDDPDTEPRLQVLREVAAGISRAEWPNFAIVPERSLAIKLVVQRAQPGDIVILAGKGHETVQRTNFGSRSRSDRQILEKALSLTQK